jgi:aspartyl/glutamyl-tRNA(Asn/Gln) amidotransferase A subunit
MSARTALGTAAAVRSGERSARDVVDESLAAIDEANVDLNAFLHVTADEARSAADAVDAQVAAGDDPGPLAGVPIALKDNLVTRGVPTSCASRILAGWVPPYDATVVQRLRAAGAISVGKTNLDEFAMGSSTENSAFGPTRNPHDRERVPGGSSGGSAAAVASGMVPLALGSDTGGSIRQPASLCGLVGVKPTYGTVSRLGLVAYGSSLDQIGPLAATVADAALLLEVICGHDPGDSTSLKLPAPEVSAHLDDGVDGLRVGIIAELMGEGIAPEVVARIRAAAEALEAAGATVEEVSVPSITTCLSAYYMVATAEASSNLSRYDGVRYGNRVEAANVTDMMTATRTQGFGDEVKRRIMLGTYALSAGYYDAFYATAQKVRTKVRPTSTRCTEPRPADVSHLAHAGVAPGREDGRSAHDVSERHLHHPGQSGRAPCRVGPVRRQRCRAAHRRAGAGSDAGGDRHVPCGRRAGAVRTRQHRQRRSRRRRLMSDAQTSTAETATTSPTDATTIPAPSSTTVDLSTWEIVIGLEVHAELATATKLFSAAPQLFGAEPNTNIDPLTLGLPGSLPVLNEQAVELAIRVGLALNCTVQRSVFARKNYFYPDLPKDYQISQYDQPIDIDGWLELPTGKIVGIERAHLEEDTGKSTHAGDTGRTSRRLVVAGRLQPRRRAAARDRQPPRHPRRRSGPGLRVRASVDPGGGRGERRQDGRGLDAGGLQRVGPPPGFRHARHPLRDQKRQLAALVGPGGRLRGRPPGRPDRGRRHRASGDPSLERERRPHPHAAGQGGGGRLPLLPEPDLVPCDPGDEWIERVRAALPVLPAARRARLGEATGGDAEGIAIVVERGLDDLVLAAIDAGADPARALTRAEHNLSDERSAELDPAAFAKLVNLEVEGKLSATQAKTVLATLVAEGGDPAEVAAAAGFEAMDTSELEGIVDGLIEANPAEWSRFCEGDQKVTGFFVGQVMRATKGQADGKVVTQLLNSRKR